MNVQVNEWMLISGIQGHPATPASRVMCMIVFEYFEYSVGLLCFTYCQAIGLGLGRSKR